MSQFTGKNIAAILAVTLLIATPAFAGDTPEEIHQRIGTGDPEAGKDLSAMCQGCHGEDGNSAVSMFPKLSGQWADYIQKQFREFQNGARQDPTMTDMALSVGEFPELFDIAAYFASQKLMKGPVIENAALLALYREGENLYINGNARSGAFRCVKCHGDHGMGEPLNNPLFPIIGGQHTDYLVKQLNDFRSNTRDNDRSGMMMLIAGRLTDHEIEAIATYLAFQAPIYETVIEETVTERNVIIIQGTNFKVGSAKLLRSAFKQLDELVVYANQNPDNNFEITGYTDSSGSLELNMKLSQARADSCRDYLVKKGIAAERLTTKGMGPANPVDDNETAEGRTKNRRIEIRTIIREVHQEETKVRVN